MLVKDVPPSELIEKLTEELKKFPELTPPQWAEYAKTGVFKEFPPVQEDWWYTRAAAILRRIYALGKPIGVSTLREHYGGRKRRGVKPNRWAKGSGHVIRTLLQQLQSAGLIEIVEKKGRVLTTKGKKLVNETAREVKAQHPELARY